MLPAVSHRKSGLALFFLLAGIAAAAPPAATPASARLTLTPCRLAHPQGITSIEADCGRLTVAESRGTPGGRTLQLFVARVPALSRQRQPEPLFILAGGPGLGAGTFYTSVASAFARIRRDRDIVIVDQRGTGQSDPLNCPFDEQQIWNVSEAETARVMSECRKRLQRDHDLAQYTTSVAVQDLDAVRQALGYERIALYGSSYGTRVAQQYARRFPARTAAVILDGVVPPTRILGPSTPLDAEAALQSIFARCQADRACAARFGDPARDYHELRDKLARSPVHVTLADPRSGEPIDLDFSGTLLAGALRLASYSAEQAALLPLTLHLANDRNQFAPLASQYLLAASGYDDVLAYGMHNSVVCAEDVPLFDDRKMDRAQLDATFLGASQIDALRALCQDWPRGPVDADLHEPLHSRVPALLLSGGADPVTPASFGAEAALGFERAQHLMLPDQGHGQLLHSCIDRVMADFLDASMKGATAAIDLSCVSRVRPAPFFLSPNGPAP
jgi:pimeloyl-ACP methyl ester carboxylesterase